MYFSTSFLPSQKEIIELPYARNVVLIKSSKIILMVNWYVGIKVFSQSRASELFVWRTKPCGPRPPSSGPRTGVQPVAERRRGGPCDGLLGPAQHQPALHFRLWVRQVIPTQQETGEFSLHCTENWIYLFPKRNCAASVPIHVSVSDLHIPRICPHIWLQKNRQTDTEIYKSLTDI